MGNGKKLGLGSGVMVCLGLIVATSCFVSLGQGFGLAGGNFIIALAAAAILNFFVALSFSELYCMMPNATGGLGQYMLVGLGPWASIVSNLSAYVITMIFATSVELSMTGIVLHGFFPQIPAAVFSVAALVILFALNLRGIDVFAKVQNLGVGLLIGSMVVFGIIGIFKMGIGSPIAPTDYAPPVTSVQGTLSLTAIAFWLFIGLEIIVPMAKELKKPKRNVLLSMVLTVAVLFVLQSVLGKAMTYYTSTESLLSAPMPHIVYAENLLGKAGGIWMGIVTLLAAVTTLNTILPATGRILQGMAEEKLVPKVFIKTNKKNAPWVGMLLMAVCNLVFLLTGYVNSSGLINMILAGSCFWLASYALTHLNVLVLRRRYPEAERQRRLKLGGVPQIIGIIGSVYMVWNISSDMDSRMQIYKLFGVLFAVLAIGAFLWIRLVQKASPFKPVSMDEINSEST